MRKLISLIAAASFSLIPVPLRAQQNTIMIQVLDGYTGVAIANHSVAIATGVTPADVKARKNIQHIKTDQRGILLMQLPSGPPGFIQLWTDDMHTCTLHPETDAFSLAEISSKGLQAPNKCGKMSVQIAPAHFIIFLRELTPAERAAAK